MPRRAIIHICDGCGRVCPSRQAKWNHKLNCKGPQELASRDNDVARLQLEIEAVKKQLQASNTNTIGSKDAPSNTVTINTTNSNKKSNMNSGMYIYVVQEREFIQSMQSIYKVGRTQSLEARMNHGYPKGSRLIASAHVGDDKFAESELIRAMDSTFRKRLDLGREYYEGQLVAIVNLFHTVALKHVAAPVMSCAATSAESTGDSPAVAEEETAPGPMPEAITIASDAVPEDIDQRIHAYVRCNKNELRGASIPIDTLYETFVRWSKGRTPAVKWKKLFSVLRSSYGVKEERGGGLESPWIVFPA